MSERGAIVNGVSIDTLVRIEAACVAAGLGAWDNVVMACGRGTLHRVEFAVRRPVDFVKEFALLVRSHGLQLGADNKLELYLGSAEALESLGRHGVAHSALGLIRSLTDVGLVHEDEGAAVPLSAVPRAAGITYIRRERPQRLAGKSVLLLDDDDVSRKILTTALKREGCRVRAVAQADAAFRSGYRAWRNDGRLRGVSRNANRPWLGWHSRRVCDRPFNG
jgi:hypothetical protein